MAGAVARAKSEILGPLSAQTSLLLEARADWFLTKPLDIDELLGILDEVIAGRDADRESH
jgi:DNA-binding response OmpR family regulator